MRRLRSALVALAALAAAGAPPALAADPPPTLTQVSPNRGTTVGGTVVTITGTNFNTLNPAAMRVKFGETVAAGPVTVLSPTQLTVATPAHLPGAVAVLVTNTDAVPPDSPALTPGYTYVFPSYAWVPRANASATGGNPGGFDLSVVDVANRVLVGSLDLNPADPDLPDDDAWRPTQVLFDTAGTHAFVATAGTPGTLDSQKVFIVKTARAVGLEAGNPVLSVIDTDGNPASIALSADGNRLFVADAGSWAASSTLLPNGTFRGYDVTDRAAPVALAGTPGTLGVLPVLHYDFASRTSWGTNSSFRGVVLSKSGRTLVTNTLSHSISSADLGTLAVEATRDVGVSGGGLIQLTVSLGSPFSDDFLYVQTTDVLTGAADYYVHRVSTGDIIPKGRVATAMNLLLAWPHPDGQSLVTVPSDTAEVVSWNPATGSAARRTAIGGGATPPALGFNDVTGLFYAREADGGWTVLSVAPTAGAAPVVAATVVDAVGYSSFRVVRDGTELVATAASELGVLDGLTTTTTKHQVVATIPLPVRPNGGPAFPQPAIGSASPRTFSTAPGGGGPVVLLPLAGSEFAGTDAPPTFEFDPAAAGAVSYFELELGSQPDFILGPGAVRVRQHVPSGDTEATPTAEAWSRVLRAAGGTVARPFFARVNAVLRGGERAYGDPVRLTLLGAVPPVAVSPADASPASATTPPTFVFDRAGNVRTWLELAGPGGFDGDRLDRIRLDPAPGGDPISFTPSARRWQAAVRRAGGGPVTIS